MRGDPAIELAGYADRLSVQPGETIRFMVSTEAGSYDSTIVRLVHGDQNPEGPGFVERPVDARGPHAGRRQVARAGSYVLAPAIAALDDLQAFTAGAWILPTRSGASSDQAIVAKWGASAAAGFALVVQPGGTLALRLAGASGPIVVGGLPSLREGRWYFVAGGFDPDAGRVRIAAQAGHTGSLETADHEIGTPGELSHSLPLTVAASCAAEATDARGPVVAEHFNGKIEAPFVARGLLDSEAIAALARDHGPPIELIVRWDFSKDQDGIHAVDVAGGGHTGRIVNAPTRAVTGHAWTGHTLDFRHVPEQYGAIHFHEDDLEDAGWEVDFDWTVPDQLESGVYAARITAGDDEDHIPFVVRPRRGARQARVALLLPTMTYLAYANERLITTAKEKNIVESAANAELDPGDDYLARHPEVGMSLYDVHSDGSGCCYSSRLRPISNLRPKYRFWNTGGTERFASDLYVVHWLEHEGIRHDVLTDEDLHREGADLLDGYAAVLTGAHPEYYTEAMLDGLQGYLAGGGRLMYLGGNGFYWVTSVDPARPHLIEVRRGLNGTRAWTSAPGEVHHSTTGEPGGLWRYRGRWPNALVGVGFTAQSDAREPAAGYVRCPDSLDDRVAFIFEGIGADEVIGEFGLINGGAAGYEIDRADAACGTPPETLRLASSRGRHNSTYLFVIEDLTSVEPGLSGPEREEVGADLTYLEHPDGGVVFSVGSCNWSASLSHNDYDNNVARISRNVLRAFMEAGS